MTGDRRTRNAQTAETLDERQWATALLAAFRENRLPQFEVPLEANILTEITVLYSRASEHARSLMKAGVTRAVAEYNPRLYRDGVLKGLAWTAASIRATDAIPELVTHVISLNEKLASDKTPEFLVAEEVLSVLAGFAPHPRVELLFRNLLFDDSVHFRLAGTLAIGLVTCDPSRFALALNRFVHRRAEGPQFFNDRSMMRGFFRAVPRGEIESTLAALDSTARPFVIAWADTLGVRKSYSAFPPDPDIISSDEPMHPHKLDFASLHDTYSHAATAPNLDLLYAHVGTVTH